VGGLGEERREGLMRVKADTSVGEELRGDGRMSSSSEGLRRRTGASRR